MIDVKYSMTELILHGHADYAEYGKDIVCSAVSTLAGTLIKKLEQESDKENVQYILADTPEEMHITICWVKQSYYHPMMEIYSTIILGLKSVAEEYPDYISVTLL